ncbi:beta-lactamase family protein [Undibacterium sp. LX40W]|uniref:Beta-lactamase family protein n=1 Tax=Undibacterium nitidum TaxID=2762298 RepID=A0A923HRE0_9BURK|nr:MULTISPECIES: serine hydrolase domain-containing protein [Undibacterium]MBC3881900.1 beta-lactamase family protein [Undibacterium nitidum]MBC3892103.1 beta-lactamase family protein [Undibacterium sp. LX40W]
MHAYTRAIQFRGYSAALVLQFALCMCATIATAAKAQMPSAEFLQTAVQSDHRPIALFVTCKNMAQPLALVGQGKSSTGATLDVDTPVRVASNTKTFVAATVLRLWEDKRIDLDAAIGPLLTPAIDQLLQSGGYDTARITVRQLLSHSAGIYDHAADDRYLGLILSQPERRWTREDLVRLAVTWGRPLSATGTAFHYSDTGYILIGDIIERITGQSLGKAVREQLQLDSYHLRSTWWEIMEEQPSTAAPRARQFIGDFEASKLDASIDLYGGGGLAMSTRDLATLTGALFEGKLFKHPETLKEMLWRGTHKGADTYRLGVFVKTVNGQDYYWHSGYWGTVAYYAPATGVAVAGASDNQDAYRRLVKMAELAVGVVVLPNN